MVEDAAAAKDVAAVERSRLELRRTLRDVKAKRLTPFERESVTHRSRALVYRTRLLIRHLKASTRVQ
jgi:hypothetical protein